MRRIRRICTKGAQSAGGVLLGVLGAVSALAGVAAGCGTVLDIDGIAYDVDAAPPPPDHLTDGSAAMDTATMVDAFVPDASVVDAPVVSGDSFAPPPMDAPPPPDGPFTLAQGLGLPQALAIDSTRLYWIDTAGVAATGSIESILKDGGSLETLAMNQSSPVDIAVDGTNVYWSVNQAPAAAGTSQCLAMFVGKDGGAPACAASGAFGSIRMTLASPYLVILAEAGNNDFIGIAAPDAGYTSVETQGPALAVTATSTALFVGNANGFHLDELVLPSLGYGPLICQANCGASPIIDLTMDESGLNVFWITQAAGVFSEPSNSTAGTAAELAVLPSAPQRMARDTSYVYVTTTNSVVAVPITASDAGPPPLTLAAGEDHPFGVAVDGARVYWTDADGTIRATNVPPAP